MNNINTGNAESQTPLTQIELAVEYFEKHNNKATVRELFLQGINSPTKLISIMCRKGYEIGKEMVFYTNKNGIRKRFIQYTLETTP